MEPGLERDRLRYRMFTYDLLSYCMNKLGFPWSMPGLEAKEDYRSNRRFQHQVGDAVLKYLRRHSRAIVRELINIRSWGSMEHILLAVAAATFLEENYVKEFFKFCVQIVTMGLDYMDRGQDWKLELIVFQMDGVYYAFLQQRFTSLGGWNILQRYAVRCCIYEE